MTGWHLAQINVGRLTAPEGDPAVQPFFDALADVNALADASPGFVWRLADGEGAGATNIKPADDSLFIVNMSVWESAEALFDFIYRSDHTAIMARRREFFERPQGAYQALWWVPVGTIPGLEEGLAKLWRIDRFGPTRHAFTFKARFAPPDDDSPAKDMRPEPWCVGWR